MSVHIVLFVVVAVLAGALTTVSGFGGGILLLLAVTALAGAKAALAATSLALLVANTHRIWLYHRHSARERPDAPEGERAQRSAGASRHHDAPEGERAQSASGSGGPGAAAVTVPLVAGLVPGGLCGSLVAASIPELAVHIAMLVIVVLGLVHARLGWTWRPGGRSLIASGLIVGVLAGAAGGAGFLIGPVILAAGLQGRPYLSTVAIASVAMHLGRLTGYGAGHMLTGEVLLMAVVLAPGLLAGNLLGDRFRDSIPASWQRGLELGMPAVCLTMALAGLG